MLVHLDLTALFWTLILIYLIRFWHSSAYAVDAAVHIFSPISGLSNGKLEDYTRLTFGEKLPGDLVNWGCKEDYQASIPAGMII